MSDNKAKPSRQIFGFSTFDLTVAVVIIVLIVVVAGISYFDSPARKGALVAYLYPLNESRQNVWIAPVNDPSRASPVTDSELGVFDFGVSPDGRFIAYSERDAETRTLDIFLLNLQTGQVEQLLDCGAEDAECNTPVFHPTMNSIVYMRIELNTAMETVGVGAPRIWVMDITTRQTQPLSLDSQTLGHSPQWSDDGNTIAFFSGDMNQSGIVIYNFTPQRSDDTPSLNFVPSAHGSVGALAPNGRRLVFPDMVARENGYFAHLKIVDFAENPPVFTNFTDPQEPLDDIAVDWHPAGQFVTIERRYLDDRYTTGFQLYNIDVETHEVTPLLVDERYSHHYFEWNRAGDMLLMQRIPLLNADGTTNTAARPEIWVLNAENGELTLISEQAFHPRWVTPQ
jgi:Tol biopolymer transport system component